MYKESLRRTKHTLNKDLFGFKEKNIKKITKKVYN